MKEERATLVAELSALIRKGNAHVSFEEAVAGVPVALRNKVPEGLPYSIWQLAEHIRITQWDILQFCRSGDHRSPPWPEGYWPAGEPVSTAQWDQTLQQVREDRARFIALLEEETNELLRPFPWGDGQHLLREALLIADHTAYHTGQILTVRRLLGCWS